MDDRLTFDTSQIHGSLAQSKTDICGVCKISCCMCIRTLSSHNRITTDQEGIVEDRAASVVSDGGLALDCHLYSSPFLLELMTPPQ